MLGLWIRLQERVSLAMASCYCILVVLLTTFVFIFLAAAAAAAGQDNNTMEPAYSSCSTTGNYSGGSQYKKNLGQLLEALPAAAGNNGWFYKGKAGARPDEVFSLIMCYADSNATECLNCLNRAAAGITTACPGSLNVNALYDECVLRYSSAPIPTTADLHYMSPAPIYSIPSTSDAVRAAWVPLMSKLTAGVATSPLRISNSSTPYSGPPEGPQEMYGLAQCTRDLNASECSTCISSYTEQLWNMFPNSTYGIIKGYSCYLRYQVWAFDVTLPPVPAPPPSAEAAPGSSSKTKIRMAIGMSVGLVSFLIILGFMTTCLLLRRRQRKAKLKGEAIKEETEDEFLMEDEFEKATGPKRFRFAELAIATDNFSVKQKLGGGGFGNVYRGFLNEMNLHVAVKRVSKDSTQGRKEYASEVRVISRLRHRNLVQLIGWCHGDGELLLVYELMPNGSLDNHLHGDASDTLLPWTLRHEIVLGLGSALLYLHDEWEQCVVHRDIKPSNVMLDEYFHAKLGDFGLARLVDHSQGSHTTAVVAGTMGYMDPECMRTGSFNKESDIYSFGILLLEVACGRRPMVKLPDNTTVGLVHRVSELQGRGKLLYAADARLNGEFDPKGMECMLLVGLSCTQLDRSLRPSIRQVVSALRFEAPLSSLPEREMPMATCIHVPFGPLNSLPSLPVDDTTRTGTTTYLSTTDS